MDVFEDFELQDELDRVMLLLDSLERRLYDLEKLVNQQISEEE